MCFITTLTFHVEELNRGVYVKVTVKLKVNITPEQATKA
jgi:hypothetical protein